MNSPNLRRVASLLSRQLLLAVLMVALLGAAAADSAASAEGGSGGKDADLTRLSLEELMNLEVETVSSASRFAQSVMEAPASVTVVTSEEIRKYGHRTLADILRSIRGFFVTNDRNYSYLGVRGFNRPGDYNSRVLLLINGHRINDNLYDQAPIGTEFPLDVDLIDRIEIVRGPSSSLYGTSAFFAVINVLTRQGEAARGGEGAFAFGSNDAFQGRLTGMGRLFTGATALLSGSFFDTRGERRIFFKEFADPASNNGIAENVDGDRNYSLFSSFNWRGFTLEGLYANREKTIPTASFGTVFNDPRNRTIDEWWYADLKFNRWLDPTLEVLARLTYDVYSYEGTYIYDRSAGGNPLLVVNKDTGYGSRWGVELQATKNLFERHMLTVGGELRDNLRQHQRNFDQDPFASYLDVDQHSYVFGVYLQDSWHITDSLLLSLGLRYDHSYVFGGSTNPRAALIYSPWEKSALKLLYGEAFRAPSAYELYYADGGIAIKANPDLKPEKIRTYEAVYEQYLGEHLRTSLSGFYYRINDLISQRLDPADGLIVFRNADRVAASGVEAEVEGRWANELAGRLSYTYHHAKDLETGSMLTNSPRHLVKGNLTSPLYRNYLFGATELQYTASRRTLAGSEAAGFVTVNLTIFCKNLLKGLELSGSVYNLFDHLYGDPGAAEHLQDVIGQEGRTFRVKLSYRF